MKTRSVTIREGEIVGPIDWNHPMAKDMPPIWREAEKSPKDFVMTGDHPDREIYAIGMYDGWPYWKPTPALMAQGPLGTEWRYFNSYGIYPGSIKRRQERARNGFAKKVARSVANPLK